MQAVSTFGITLIRIILPTLEYNMLQNEAQ